MGILERRQRQKTEVRVSILQAAWEVVLAEGWQALSIRKIADAIEYSVPVIYTHFENKDAILHEFTKAGFRLLTEAITQQRDSQTNASRQLEAMAEGYWNFAIEQKEYYQLMFGLGIPACEQVERTVEMQQFAGIVHATIQEVIRAGSQPSIDAFLKYHTYLSILHGLVSIQITNSNETVDPWSKLVLKDAINGFINSLNG